MRIPLLAALAAVPLAAPAQGVSFRIAPQAAGYRLKQGSDNTVIGEIAIPMAIVVPITSRLTFDVATAYAQVLVKPDIGDESKINGLTDTQVRFNYTLGTDAIVLTAGVNIPTGKYKVEEDAIAAAGSIGNDFYAFPVSSFGNGLGATGGIAAAKSLGAWNFGLGASFRKTQEFDAFETGTVTTQFEPGNEIRLRLGVDRAVGNGRVTLGGIYSNFGDDKCSTCPNSVYSSGDRLIGQAALDLPAGPVNFYFGGWLLHHAKGENVSGDAPPENIMDGMVAIGFNAGSTLIEPNIETRVWSVDGNSAGNITYGGLRLRFGTGAVQVSPSLSFGVGSLKTPDTDLMGFKGGLTIRIGG